MTHRPLSALVFAASALGCAKAERTAPKQEGPRGVVAAVPVATGNAAHAPQRPDPQALAELIRAAPSSAPRPTNPEGGTLIGSEADSSARVAMSSAAPARSRPVIRPGNVVIRSLLSSPSLERAARAQIYWQLAHTCRRPEGELPPADSVTLQFTIRSDGTVFPGSVRAEAKDKRYDEVAYCVERVFSASGFRGPAEGRNTTSDVVVTWPSVD
jgi:hypothetical protein